MVLENTTTDGRWTNGNGENIFPYKGDEEPIHDPSDYDSDDVNREVA